MKRLPQIERAEDWTPDAAGCCGAGALRAWPVMGETLDRGLYRWGVHAWQNPNWSGRDVAGLQWTVSDSKATAERFARAWPLSAATHRKLGAQWRDLTNDYHGRGLEQLAQDASAASMLHFAAADFMKRHKPADLAPAAREIMDAVEREAAALPYHRGAVVASGRATPEQRATARQVWDANPDAGTDRVERLISEETGLDAGDALALMHHFARQDTEAARKSRGSGADLPKPGATLNPKALRSRALKTKAGYFWTVFPDATEAWRWWRFNPADELDLASSPFPNRGAAELDVIRDFHAFTPTAAEVEVKQGKPTKRQDSMAMTVYARCPQGAGALTQGERGMNWNKLAGNVRRAEKAHAKAERAVYVALVKLGKALVKHGRGKRDCNIAGTAEAKALEHARKEVHRLAQAHKEAAAALK